MHDLPNDLPPTNQPPAVPEQRSHPPILRDEHGPGEAPRRRETITAVTGWLCITFLLALLIIRLT